jgi:hypothetical protein
MLKVCELINKKPEQQPRKSGAGKRLIKKNQILEVFHKAKASPQKGPPFFPDIGIIMAYKTFSLPITGYTKNKGFFPWRI